jgi:hypothetical protein
MEKVNGTPITEYARERSLALPDLLDLFLRVCEVIGSAHDMGVIHCDLKPEHILIDKDGAPHVLDFGLARLYDPSIPPRLTNLLAGTPAYMSPEQATDEAGGIGPWTDVYALGVILYELLAGRRPYDVASMTPEGIRRAILDANPEGLGRLNGRCRGELEAVVARAIEKEPERRFRDLSAFIARISRVRSRPFLWSVLARTASLASDCLPDYIGLRVACVFLLPAAFFTASAPGILNYCVGRRDEHRMKELVTRNRWVGYDPPGLEEGDARDPGALIGADLDEVTRSGFTGIVTYGGPGALSRIPEMARDCGLKVIMGVRDASDPIELDLAVAQRDHVDSYCVGHNGLNKNYRISHLDGGHLESWWNLCTERGEWPR